MTETYSFPVARDVRLRNRTFLADVDDDVFRSQTVLLDQSESNISTALRTFNVPFRGCSPRPLNRPGGSARKLPAFSFRPSMVANRYGFSSSSLASFILYVSVVRLLSWFTHAFFSSLVIDFFFSRSASKCSYIGLKSHFSSEVTLTFSFWFDQCCALLSLNAYSRVDIHRAWP